MFVSLSVHVKKAGKGLGECWDASRIGMLPLTLLPDGVMLVSHAHRAGPCWVEFRGWKQSLTCGDAPLPLPSRYHSEMNAAGIYLPNSEMGEGTLK